MLRTCKLCGDQVEALLNGVCQPCLLGLMTAGAREAMTLSYEDFVKQFYEPPPTILSESCPDCARKIMKRPEAGVGFLAKCGRRLVNITDTRLNSPCPENLT